MKYLLFIILVLQLSLIKSIQQETQQKDTSPLMFGIISEKCFQKVVVDRNVDIPCIKFTISKLLGLAIVFLAPLAKLPQIINIVKASSVEGLSFTSNFIDCLSYTLTLAFNLRFGNPFSTYGESVFLLFQNLTIFLLFMKYSKDKKSFYEQLNYLFLYFSLAAILIANVMPIEIYQYLVIINIVLLLSSRLPQISLNYQQKSTGTLSLITTLLFFGGSVARMITILIEIPDFLQQFSYVLASLLNGTVFFQIILYWNSKTKLKKQ